MSRINTNVAALRGIYAYQRNQSDLGLRLQRLSTGLRINRGADDPSGLIISERLRSEARGLQQAIDNSIRADNVLSTAEGALNEVSSLLLQIQSLVVTAANEDGLTTQELEAKQLEIDSILASIDRIANTTRFGNDLLLNGARGYVVSSLTTAALASVSVFAAHVVRDSTRSVRVQVTQSAQVAELGLIGTNASGASVTSAVTIELRGTLGAEILSLAAGTTLAQIRDAINDLAALTGVSAVVSSTGAPGVASALRLSSRDLGGDAFVSVTAIGGEFVNPSTRGVTLTDFGRDAEVYIDGQRAQVHGLRADVRTADLDTRVYLTDQFAQTLSSATFGIAGGGAIFQITPDMVPNGQGRLGLASVRTSQLGNAVVGLLHSLGSGRDNELSRERYAEAQAIVNEAVDQVASYRGRLGAFQRTVLGPAINAQGIAVENVTAAESIIRDADFAAEVSALTRAQILVQSTGQTLQIANSVPTQVLALLG